MASLPFTYASVDDVWETIPYVNSNSDVSSATILQHGGMAQALVNAKLSKCFVVPFTTVPPIVQMITTHITCWYLLAGSTVLAASLKDSPWPKTYKEAFGLLDKIATGELAILTSSGTVIEASNIGSQVIDNNAGFTPTFSELPFELSKVDPDKIDTLEAERE